MPTVGTTTSEPRKLHIEKGKGGDSILEIIMTYRQLSL